MNKEKYTINDFMVDLKFDVELEDKFKEFGNTLIEVTGISVDTLRGGIYVELKELWQ